MAHLIIAEQGKLKKYEITEDFLFIGRTPENQIRISDAKAGRQHCQILKTETGFRLIDLGTPHGTLVGGKPVKQKDLAEGDIIQIGDVKIAVKELGPAKPAAAPASPHLAAARRPAGPSAAGPAGRGSRRPRPQAEPEITIRPEMAAAAARGGHLVRKRLREGSRIPGWAQGVIAFWVVVIIAGAVYYAVTRSSSPYGEVYEQALDLWESLHDAEAAYAELEQIPIDDPVYGAKSREVMQRIVAERQAGNLQFDTLNASRAYSNNIIQFIEEFIDAPPGNTGKELKIKRDYAASRSSYVRVLLKDRINYFLERYGNAPQAEDVKRLKAKYGAEVNLDAPPTYRDVEVEAECAIRLSGYGKAYQVISQWLAGNPNTDFRERSEWMFKNIWEQLNQEWEIDNADIARNEADNKPHYAIKRIDRMLKLTEGLDSPEGQKFRADLERRRAANVAKLEALRGGAAAGAE